MTCIIVGVRNISAKEKYIYWGNTKKVVKNINPYLAESNNIFIYKRAEPLSQLPKIEYGNMAIDGGNLLLSLSEKQDFLSNYPNGVSLVKKIVGAQELINGSSRYCLWINDKDLDFAKSIPFIKERIEATRKFRLSGKDSGTHKLALKPHQFREMKLAKRNSIIIPTVTSEKREYLPIAFLTSEDIIIAPNQAIYDPEPWTFSLISSRMHMIWIKAVAGKLEDRLRYSGTICYNTFPFPNITPKQKESLTTHVYNILEEREKYPEKTMADLYDPDKMPDELREAHKYLDLAIDQIYRSKPFENDEERLAHLFKLYEEMIIKERQK